MRAARQPTRVTSRLWRSRVGRVSGLHTPRVYRLRALNTRGSEGDGPRLAARRDGDAAVRPREPRARHHAAWRGWRTRSRVFPRADAAPALAHPDPDLDGDSDESSDNSLASTASDDTDDGGDPRRGFSDGFLRSQLPGTCQSKKQHLWNAVAETGRHASATRTPTPEPDGVRSLTDITAATVESATGPARPESPEDPRRRPRDDDGDSCAPTPEGDDRRGDAPPAPPRTDASRS